MGASEVGTRQIGSRQFRAAQIGTGQVCKSHQRATEIGVGKICPDKSAPDRSARINPIDWFFTLVCFWIILLIGIAVAIAAMWSMLYRLYRPQTMQSRALS